MINKLTPSTSTVASVGLGVPISTVFAWALNTFAAIEVPGEVQAALGAIISAVVGYMFVGGRREDTE